MTVDKIVENKVDVQKPCKFKVTKKYSTSNTMDSTVANIFKIKWCKTFFVMNTLYILLKIC